jgi:phosphoribosyl 1,2-cyclic phosphate phosphodiesterase
MLTKDMKVTFLGTGTSQGVPVIGCECEVCTSLDFRDKRLRSSVLIEIHGFNLVIDTGPDFRQQMLNARIKHLDAVLFTHEHKDHTAGLDDIRAFNFLQKKDMPIYARFHVIEQLKREFAYIFAEKKYPGIPQIEVNEINLADFYIQGQKIIPIEVLHHKLPVLGFRIEDFCYITDANSITEVEKEKIKGSKVLVLNALQQTEHISHFTLTEALDLIAEIQPEKAYLTHLSHRMGTHAHTSKQLPNNVEFSYDGLTISL